MVIWKEKGGSSEHVVKDPGKISAHNVGSVVQDSTTAHAMDIKLSKKVHLSLSEEGQTAN